ncbi:hypothetical protein M8J76_001477 [Diaphorina citri]|nr:hypothetical protein M8J75_003379 [Diaphorina citri]KAI5736253.1 hypothetical protein M8J76_001477 [Diaphorina citri]
MVQGNIGFRTCQFVLNYIVYTASVLVMVLVVYALAAIYLKKPPHQSLDTSTDTRNVSDDVGIVEDYAFIVENELDEIKFNRFRNALRPADRKGASNGDDFGNADAKMKANGIVSKCPCSRLRPDPLKYFHLITTNPLCFVTYLGAITGTLIIGFYLSHRFGFSFCLK